MFIALSCSNIALFFPSSMARTAITKVNRWTSLTAHICRRKIEPWILNEVEMCGLRVTATMALQYEYHSMVTVMAPGEKVIVPYSSYNALLSIYTYLRIPLGTLLLPFHNVLLWCTPLKLFGGKHARSIGYRGRKRGYSFAILVFNWF